MAEKEPEKQKEVNALVAANMQMNGTGLEIRTLQDAKLVAETFIASKLVPKHFDTGAKVIVAIQAGFELGFKPWQALNNLHVVNGQVGIKSSAMGGLVRTSGKCKTMRQFYEGKKGNSDYRAVIVSQRTDDVAEHRTEFSVADAQAAGLLGKDNWKHYQDDMLMWRALSRHGRQFYGDVLSGFYTVDELQEFHPPQAAPGPEAPSREDRKQAEDVKVTDTKEAIKEQLEKCLNKFIGFAESEVALNRKLVDLPAPVLNEIFAKFAGYALRGPAKDGDGTIPNYRNAEAYTLENLTQIQAYLEQNGIPDNILALFPMTVEEAETHLEEKLREWKYKCVCGHQFDEPGGSKKVKLCPKCLSKDIIEIDIHSYEESKAAHESKED